MKLIFKAIVMAAFLLPQAVAAGKIEVEHYPSPAGMQLPFSDAVRVGHMLYLSGQIGTNWTSTLGANAEVNAYQLVFAIEGTDHGDSADYSITLDDCVFSGTVAEGDPSTIQIQFTAYDLYPAVA